MQFRVCIALLCYYVRLCLHCNWHEGSELQPVLVFLFVTCLHENALVFQLHCNGELPFGGSDGFHGRQVDGRSEFRRGAEDRHLAVAHHHIPLLPDGRDRTLDVDVAGHRLEFRVRTRSDVVPTGTAV